MMTEERWLAATDWRKMRWWLPLKLSKGRKARLFAVACSRRVAHLSGDSRCDEALAVSELFADERASRARLREAEEAALVAVREAVDKQGPQAIAWARDAAWRTSRATSVWHGARSCLNVVSYRDVSTEVAAQTVLLRDIFGNPYRPVVLDPAWLTSDVLALARGIYEEKAFDRTPILADALQDAGCASEDVLSHCRDTSLTHVRGCWVVDVLLGKE